MNKIHTSSQITTIPELDLFSLPPTQFSIEKTITSEYRPLSTLASNSIIEFSVSSGLNEYINLRDTVFHLRVKINIKKNAGGNIDENDWKKIQPVNNLLHSIFRTVDLEIEGKSITQSPQTYAYKAFFESYLGYTLDAKSGVLSSSLFYNDESKKSGVSEAQGDYIKPSTVTGDGKGVILDLAGKLHLDLLMQPKSLIGGTKLKFTLVPNDPSFYLYASDDTLSSTVDFDSAALYVTKSIVSYPVVEAHNLMIAETPIKYPIARGVVKSFTVNQGSLDISIDNAITGIVPRRCFLVLVDSKAYNGQINYNPFKFDHFKLNYLAASLDGVQYPTVAYTPNFTKDLYMREFLGLYETLNQLTTDTILMLDREEYKAGNTIFGFNFAPDPTDDCNKVGYFNPQRYGSIRFILKFSSALSQNINVLIYAEYDSLITIDGTRTPMCDYL